MVIIDTVSIAEVKDIAMAMAVIIIQIQKETMKFNSKNRDE